MTTFVMAVPESFEPLDSFIGIIDGVTISRDKAYEEQAHLFYNANLDSCQTVARYVNIRNEVKAVILESEQGIALKEKDSKYHMTYAGHCANAVIALLHNAPADDRKSVKLLSEYGLKVMETSGKDGGFIADYVCANARKQTHVKAGTNPETGLPMAAKEKRDFAQKAIDEKALNDKVAINAQFDEDAKLEKGVKNEHAHLVADPAVNQKLRFLVAQKDTLALVDISKLNVANCRKHAIALQEIIDGIFALAVLPKVDVMTAKTA